MGFAWLLALSAIFTTTSPSDIGLDVPLCSVIVTCSPGPETSPMPCALALMALTLTTEERTPSPNAADAVSGTGATVWTDALGTIWLMLPGDGGGTGVVGSLCKVRDGVAGTADVGTAAALVEAATDDAALPVEPCTP